MTEQTKELHALCEEGNLDALKQLISEICKQEKTTFIDFSSRFQDNQHNGCTILHTAARNNHVSILEYLFSLGISLDVEDKSLATPLMYAVMRGSGDAVAYLASKGANVNVKDFYNNSVLLKAITLGYYDLAEILIRAGADINVKVGTKDQTLLHDACQRGDLTACQFLLDLSASIARKDIDDRTSLFYALPYPKIVKLLCEHAVKSNQFSKLIRALDVEKYTVLHKAVLSDNVEALTIILDMITEFSPLLAEDMVNEKGRNEQTPLHLAVKTNNYQITTNLLRCEYTNPNIQDARGDTPMHVAVRYGCGNILEMLLENDRAQNSRNIRNTDKLLPQELAKELQIDVDHVFNGFKDSRFQVDFIGRDTIRKYRFVVFVFYRGSWCRTCKNMLERLNHIIDDVHALNGELIGVSSESAAARAVMKSLKLSYNVIDDEKGTLAKQMGVKIAKKNSHTFNGIIQLLKTHNMQNTLHKIEQKYPNGMAQPAIVIVRRDGQVVYRWISTPLEKNAFGMFERIEVPHIANLIKFYFNNVIQVESISRFIDEHRDSVLDQIMENTELHDMFLKFLQNERYPQALYFVESMNHFKKEAAQQIYDRFVNQQSPDAIRIPSSLRAKHNSIKELDVEFLMELYLSVVDELKGERLDNFVATPDFVERGVKLLPFMFTIPMDFDELNESILTRQKSSPRMLNRKPSKVKRNAVEAEVMIRSKSFRLFSSPHDPHLSLPLTMKEKEEILSNPKSLIQEASRIRDFVMKK
jgi:ankyrin repeat protein/peroxiredoxin